MGGKTQQRVAGNVKPSSSGRIRELLGTNHGPGNMITFSVLSNGTTDATSAVQKSPKDEKKIESPRRRAPPSAHRGVFKPPPVVETFESLASNNEIERQYENEFKVEKRSDQSLSEFEPKESAKEEEYKQEVAPEEAFNFDQLLEELDNIQSQGPSVDAHVVQVLDENSIEQDQNLIKLLSVLVRKFSDEMSIEEWDLINRSLNRLIGIVSRSKLTAIRAKQADFCRNILDFIHQLIQLAQEICQNKTEDQEELPMTQLLLEDWKNFCTSQIYKDLIGIYFNLASIDNLSPETLMVLESISSIITTVDPKFTIYEDSLIRDLDSTIEFDPDLDLPENCNYLPLSETKFKGFMATCRLLRSNNRPVLISAHSLLSRTIGDVCSRVRETFVLDQDESDKMMLVPPAALMSILTSRDSMMSALLSDYRDASVTIEPSSDSYSCTLSYLFTWDLAIRFIVGLSKEVGHQIIHCFKRLGLTQRLLDHIFMLLPPLEGRDALNLRLLNSEKSDGSLNESWCLSEYLKSPLSANIKQQTLEIELTALHVYFSVALHMPVTVRKWFNNNSKRRLCNLVNEYTTKHISCVICSLEMETVQEQCQERANELKENNLVIRARPSANEVYAMYTRDEFKMELTIKLPSNYPLSPVLIDGGKRVGVTDVKWRSWLLQLTTFLSHQNGPILDGIDLWRRNIDKKFEGVEKCMICFSILNSNYQLPKKKCATCSHAFHSFCLYKWFETSGNTTCALCRSIWW